MKSRLKTTYVGVFFVFLLLMFVTPDISARPTEPPIEDPPEPPDPTVYPYTIIGYAKDSSSHSPISGATVKYYKGSTYIGKTTTRSDGRFRKFYSSTSPVSSFKVKISKSGYSPVTRTKATSEEMCNFGNVYLTALKTYTVYGNVKEMYSGIEIPSSSVAIYTGSTYLGQATTYSDSGYFTFSYSTSSTYTTFTAKASKPGYADAEKTATGSGTSFNIGDVLLDTHKILIASNYFTYDPDAYLQYWRLWADGNHDTSYENGYAQVFETSGTRIYHAYVVSHLDLSMWTGLSPLELQVRFRATSDYSGSSSVTRATFGLAKYDTDPALPESRLWYEPEHWTNTRDTGWITRTFTIPVENLISPGTPESTTYDFYFGFEDAWSHPWNQRVQLDWLLVYGDSYAEGPLTKTRDMFHTEPGKRAFDFGGSDVDDVAVTYSSSVSSFNNLGFVDGIQNDPHFESAICIAIDPDIVETTSNGWHHEYYNLVDKVKIRIDLENLQHVAAGGAHVVEGVQVNQEIGTPGGYDFPLSGLLGVASEPLGWEDFSFIAGGVIKLGFNAFSFIYDAVQHQEPNTLDFGWGEGYAEATFDFGDTNGIAEGLGTTDFKMKLVSEATSLTSMGIFRLMVSYEVVLKQVTETITPGGWPSVKESFSTFYFTDNITLVKYADFTDIHVVHLASPEADSHITCSHGSGTYIYDTDYYGNWKVVIGSTITITADTYYERYVGQNPRIFNFDRLETSFWKEDRLRLIPIVTTSTTLVYTFDPNAHFYLFRAFYTMSAN